MVAPGTTVSPTGIDLARLWWAGPLTILAAIVAVLVVRVIAFAVMDLSAEFQPLSWGAPIVFTAVLVTAAVFTFAAIARAAANPSTPTDASRSVRWRCR